MGLFKNMKDLRDIHKMSKDIPRPSLGDSIGQMKDALETYQGDAMLAQQLAASGVSGNATIHSLAATGKTVNEMPELLMDVTVTVNGFETRVPEHRQVVSPAMLGQLVPGATLPCKADPQDNSKVIVGMA